MEAGLINRPTLWGIVFRSFLIESAWNYERLTNIGFLFSLGGVIRRLFKSGEQKSRVMIRHLQSFNTHPFMASYILGMVTARESRLRDTSLNEDEEEHITMLKRSTMGPLAAIGDALFWSAVRPIASLIAVAIVLVGFPNVKIMIWGPVVFLVAFNLPHLVCRVQGVFQGYVRGTRIIKDIQGWNVPRLVYRLHYLGIAILGIALAACVKNRPVMPEEMWAIDILWMIGVLGLILLMKWLLRRISPSKLIFIFVCLSVLIITVSHELLFD
jgi:PTS system mannose-specific IID component